MKEKIFHDRYEILEKIGSGGTSLVYKARDVLLNRLVTIKILREQFASDEAFVRRFRNEAQAVACLSHPNIVSIYDVVFTEDSHYLVMEYVEGCSLKEYLDKNGQMPVVLATDIACQILDALQHAHDHNVIHRDIKPHNILLDQNMQVKVTDFGIAVALTDITQTYTGDVMGSVHYMSPEQVQGSAADERSDIYSAGVVLYELLTGKQPFLGDNVIGVAMQHIQSEVLPPHKINPDVPLELSFIVMRAMRKNPDLRYASAKDMRDNLKKLDFRKISPNDEMSNYDDNYANNYNNNDLNDMPKRRPQPKAVNEHQKADRPDVRAVKKPKKKLSPTTWIIIAVAALLAISAIIFFSMAGGFFNSNKDVTVPNVVGKQLSEAEAMLKSKNLQYTVNYVNDNNTPENQVMEQDIPADETVKEGRSVALTVSKGAEKVKVPNVSGYSVTEATRLLQDKGLAVGSRRGVIDDTAEPGTIVSQDPESGTEVAIGTKVNLYVSKGKEVTMPNLEGKTLDQAKSMLTDNSLKLGNTNKEESTTYPAGVVIGQSTAAGSKIFEGNTIDLTISDGPGAVASTARVTYTLPTTNPQYAVKITVIDTTGSHQEYSQTVAGGETINEDVPFYGKGTIEILLDDSVVYSQAVP